MARRKTLPDLVRSKCDLAERLTALRSELFGERGGPELARRLGLPIRTWYNYEAGVTIPAEVILRIVELTHVEPSWLLHGQGPKFRAVDLNGHCTGTIGAPAVKALLEQAIALMEAGRRATPLRVPASKRPSEAAIQAEKDCVLLPVVDAESESESSPGGDGPRYLVARPDWLDGECACLRMTDDAMEPVVARGASVVHSSLAEPPDALDGRLVVAWVGGRPLVRWFERHGRYFVLRGERVGPDNDKHLVELIAGDEPPTVRRVLWVSTPH